MWCGTGPESRAAREQWSLRDITPMIREHFGAARVDGGAGCSGGSWRLSPLL